MTSNNFIHLAIIPDGNRRWAKSRNLHAWKGHEQAIKNFRSITQWCRNNPRISILTVWCFSTENWKRNPKEINMLMTILENYLRKEQEEFTKNKTRFLHSGRKDRIPKSLAQLIEKVEKNTKNQSEFTLHLAVDYGGKDEIIRAMNNYLKTNNNKSAQLDEQQFKCFFDHPELKDIDLIIRTSGEKRTSNFFLWQSTYAEWVFSEKLFPNFNVNDLATAIDNFEKRSRRFGT